MSTVKKICICAFCVALCYVLPPAFHAMALGSLLSPMHLPVLLCGLLCGWPYGAFCGIAGPLLSSLLSGMPGTVALIYMIPELCVYGLVTGLGMSLIHTGRTTADVYLSLVPAMLLGRVIGGLARALFYLSNAETYTIALWASSYVVGTLPALLLQFIVLPLLVLTLTKAGLIPRRYELSGAVA